MHIRFPHLILIDAGALWPLCAGLGVGGLVWRQSQAAIYARFWWWMAAIGRLRSADTRKRSVAFDLELCMGEPMRARIACVEKQRRIRCCQGARSETGPLRGLRRRRARDHAVASLSSRCTSDVQGCAQARPS
ncbi:hypothetical protein L1887_61398 [Cichorium endivia]|nr:hypothetical protein L1887_61398 [Cichorium endivia]